MNASNPFDFYLVEFMKGMAAMRNDLSILLSKVTRLNKTPAQHISDEWLTPDQVMLALKISVRTLDKLKYSGKLPYTKIYGLIYFSTIDIENMLKQHSINRLSNNKLSTFQNTSDESDYPRTGTSNES
ncbi:MAG TPA: helix-turn-helix domain-containing protein [Prolixibacteraceae bacterium]